MKLAFDAVTPPATPPDGAIVACIYAGGDTPHPIADPSSVPVYTRCRFWLPGWVRSNPTPTMASSDAMAMVAWLRRNGAPRGCATFLDLEGSVTPSYVTAYGAFVHGYGGFLTLPYTALSNMDATPVLAGHFLSHPGPAALWPGTVATQFAFKGSYDLSLITDTVPLWTVYHLTPEVASMSVTIATGIVAVTGVSNGHKFLMTAPVDTRAEAAAWSVLDLTDVAASQHVTEATDFTV